MAIDTVTLLNEMISLNHGLPDLIQHLIKVHAFSRQIAIMENIPSDTLDILEAAALTHDIGIRYCNEKYGSCNGKLQEQEGPAIARELLTRLGYAPDFTERICYLIGHHHTYTAIDGIDYQILVEADFLVNLFEGNSAPEAVRTTLENIFRTESGKRICRDMFGI